MSGHFAAFTFIDRITGLTPGRAATGQFLIPAELRRFPPSLLAEAVGQLAAWVSIAHLGFRVRPVAALAFETRFVGAGRPGDLLELAVNLDSCEEDAVAYQGRASVAGSTVLELVDCIGPMLPLADFDDAEAMRRFLAVLCSAGAPPGRFAEVPEAELEVIAREPGRSAQARLQVPVSATFFDDHFPRRPVFPATLLLDAQMLLAAEVAAEALGGGVLLSRVTDVKQRSFVEPGATVEIDVAISASEADRTIAAITSRMNDRRLGGARVEFTLARKP